MIDCLYQQYQSMKGAKKFFQGFFFPDLGNYQP